jgi:plastocyanin
MRAAGTVPALAIVLALAAAGCGEKRATTTGGASGTGGGSSSPAGGALSISETEFKLTPSSEQVDKGGPVTIKVKNDGGTAHALKVEGPNGEVQTGTIAPGKSATLKADLSKPGSYEMYCPIDGHKDKGMKGEIKVGSAGSSSDDNGGSSGGSSGGGGGGY